MLMATDAGEVRKVARRRMAIEAAVPLSLMCPGVDPEVLLVVVECRGQPRIRRMALVALVAELVDDVVRVRGDDVV